MPRKVIIVEGGEKIEVELEDRDWCLIKVLQELVGELRRANG